MKPENIFAQIAEAGEEEQFDLLFKSPNCRIDRIVSSGHSSPKGFWYDQENDEFILLIQGEATLEFEDRKVTLKKGDYLHIPKNCKHRLDLRYLFFRCRRYGRYFFTSSFSLIMSVICSFGRNPVTVKGLPFSGIKSISGMLEALNN